jgi:hypothetical protein
MNVQQERESKYERLQMQLPYICAFVPSHLQGEITGHPGSNEEDLRPQFGISYTEMLTLWLMD